MKKERLFSRHDLMLLVVPLVIEQALAISVGMADTMMVSRAGEAAVSGVSLVDMINQLIITLLAALGTGGAVITSQYLGAKEGEKANQSASQLTTLSGIGGLGMMVFCLVFARPMLRLFFGTISDEVMAACMTYLYITALSYPFLALYNAGAAIFRSMGNSRISMQVSVLMNIINLVGNAICIFGLKMGVAGVAVPSLISRAVAAVIILWLSADIHNKVHITGAQLIRLDGGMSRRILHIGVPSALENSIFQLGRVVVVSMISTFGTVQIAANAIANNLDAMGCIIGQAFCLAMVTVVGRCVGARDNEQVVYYTKRILWVDMLLQGAGNLLVLLSLNSLIGLYAVSPETASLAHWLVSCHAGFAILLWPVCFVLPNMLRAANDVKFTMWVSILSMVIWRLGFSYILAQRMGMGAKGVWIAMIVDWVCRAIFFVGRFVGGKWKTKYAAA